MLVYPAGGFVLQHPTKGCSSESALNTIQECERAKAALDPRASGRVGKETYSKSPKGCSRWHGEWWFNSHYKGALDGESEPVCKTAAGKASRI